MVPLAVLTWLLSSFPAHAGAPSDEWLSLDRELGALAARAGQDPEGVRIGGLLRVNFADWDNFQPPPPSGDFSGFTLDNVRAWVAGETGDVGFKVQVEGFSGTVLVLDAYGTWNLTESIRATLGQFQPGFLWSALVPPERLLFILRTADGQFWHARDRGFQLDGGWDRLHWSASIENGGDGVGDENAFTARLAFDALGEGVGLVQGAWNAPQATSLTIAAAFHDDGSAAQDGDVLALDAALTSGRFAAHGELLDYADDGGGGTGVYSVFSDTSPWSLDASYMLMPDTWEIAVRYQDADDAQDAGVVTVGLNYYAEGHDAKWMLDWADKDTDSSATDASVVAIGLSVNV